MSLFGNLPPTASSTRFIPAKAAADEPPHSEEHPAKRLKTEAEDDKQGQTPEEKLLLTDQVAAALKKIRCHIGKASKFAKASGLFRQLLDNGSISQAHKHSCFKTIRSAFSDLKQVSDPQLRREYIRLMRSIQSNIELFTKAERAHIEVYKIFAHVLNELFTDDSFMFTRTTNRVKELITALPAAVPAEDATLAAVLSTSWSPDDDDDEELAPPPPPPPLQSDPESDPFGLDALIQVETQPRAREPPSKAWSPAETLCMRRQALADCVCATKALHKHAWAKTTVELLIEQVHLEHTGKFCGPQREALRELWVFVSQQRVLRKQGKVAEVNRDLTSFDKARAAWSKATVSHRGKVGGGDHQSEAWLG